MDPSILEVLSLYSIHIHPHTARLLVDHICKNYSVSLPEFYLNQMASLVSYHSSTRFVSRGNVLLNYESRRAATISFGGAAANRERRLIEVI